MCQLSVATARRNLNAVFIIDDHKNKECLKRPFRCDRCGDYKSTFEDVIMKHSSICPCSKVPCCNERRVYPKHKDLTKHLAEECPLEVIKRLFV